MDLFFVFVLFVFFLQVAKHPLHLQHGPGHPDLARLHRAFADGAQHLVLRGQHVLQVPVLLQGVQHDEILNPRPLSRPLLLSLSPSLIFPFFFSFRQ